MHDLTSSDAREREAAELKMLEELWAAPARAEPRPSRLAPAAAWLSGRIGWLLAAGWLVFMVSIFFEPAPNPDAVTPLWADALVGSFFLALGAAGILGAVRAGTSAYVASAVAGVLGLGIAAACSVTDHHPAGWWVWEHTAMFALTVGSGAALALRAR